MSLSHSSLPAWGTVLICKIKPILPVTIGQHKDFIFIFCDYEFRYCFHQYGLLKFKRANMYSRLITCKKKNTSLFYVLQTGGNVNLIDLRFAWFRPECFWSSITCSLRCLISFLGVYQYKINIIPHGGFFIVRAPSCKKRLACCGVGRVKPHKRNFYARFNILWFWV